MRDITVHLVRTKRRRGDEAIDEWVLRWPTTSGKRKQTVIGRVKPKHVSKAKRAPDQLTRPEAEELRDRKLAELKTATSDVVIDGETSMTVAGFRKWFLDHCPRISKGRRANVKKSLGYLGEKFGEDSCIRDIKARHAMTFESWLADLDKGRAEDKLSETTVRGHLANVKHAFTKAVSAELIERNPFAAIETTPPKPDKDWDELTEQDIELLIEACSSPEWKALVGLCAYAGVRRGEAMRLTWLDIKWDRNRLIVRNPGRTQTTKHRTREVYLEPALETLLLDVRETTTSDRPAAVAKNNLHRNMGAVIERAGVGLNKEPFQTLRRWRDSAWKVAGRDPFTVDAWLGHSGQVSRDHYFRVPETMYEREADEPVPRETDDEVARLEAELAELRAQIASS